MTPILPSIHFCPFISRRRKWLPRTNFCGLGTVLNNLCESQWLILEPDNILGMKDCYSLIERRKLEFRRGKRCVQRNSDKKQECVLPVAMCEESEPFRNAAENILPATAKEPARCKKTKGSLRHNWDPTLPNKWIHIVKNPDKIWVLH